MQPYKYTPQACKGKGKLTGHVMLKPRSFDQRWGMLEDSGLKMDAEGNALEGIENISAIRNCVRMSKDFYKDVSIKNGSTEFKSFEEMSMDSSVDHILIDIAMHLVGGAAPGEK